MQEGAVSEIQEETMERAKDIVMPVERPAITAMNLEIYRDSVGSARQTYNVSRTRKRVKGPRNRRIWSLDFRGR